MFSFFKNKGWHPYTYRNTQTASLGKGVSEMALNRPTSLVRDGFAGPRYNVRGQLDPQAPAYVKIGQQFVPVSLVGNGLGFFTGINLQALTNSPQVKSGEG